MKGTELTNQNQMMGKKNRSVAKVDFSESFMAFERPEGRSGEGMREEKEMGRGEILVRMCTAAFKSCCTGRWGKKSHQVWVLAAPAQL